MRKISRLLGIMLSLIVLISVVPQNVLADENESGRYVETMSYVSKVGDAEIDVYSTKNGGKVNLIGHNTFEEFFPMSTGYRVYEAVPNNGWIWKGWTFKQIQDGNDLGNRTDYVGGTRYSFSNPGDDWHTAYDGGTSISVNRVNTHVETVWTKISYSIYANFNPTVTATVNGEGGAITDQGIQKEVEYGRNVTYTITAS